MTSAGIVRVVVCLVVASRAAAQPPELASAPVCANRDLRSYVNTIHKACASVAHHCDFSKLSEINSLDKPAILAALRNPYLFPVHVFYPEGQSALSMAYDPTTKRDQLKSLKASIVDPEKTYIFVIGQASITGPQEFNRQLSQARMQAVLEFLRNDLQLNCKDFMAGFLGQEVMQLSISDAASLGIDRGDYRDNPLILNQAVHVFLYPCAENIDVTGYGGR